VIRGRSSTGSRPQDFNSCSRPTSGVLSRVGDYDSGGWGGFAHTVLVDVRERPRRSARSDRVFEVALEAAHSAGLGSGPGQRVDDCSPGRPAAAAVLARRWGVRLSAGWGAPSDSELGARMAGDDLALEALFQRHGEAVFDVQSPPLARPPMLGSERVPERFLRQPRPLLRGLRGTGSAACPCDSRRPFKTRHRALAPQPRVGVAERYDLSATIRCRQGRRPGGRGGRPPAARGRPGRAEFVASAVHAVAVPGATPAEAQVSRHSVEPAPMGAVHRAWRNRRAAPWRPRPGPRPRSGRLPGGPRRRQPGQLYRRQGPGPVAREP